ncbi:MAG TPA: Ig-like domain-containing protein [Gemmatimonadaceae bacterium]|nr:Ig-like domain-containing protein [Gemmatimonadaceae bacterium]
MRRLTVALFLTAACASPGMPPGGPPDVAAPEILSIVPDSGRTGVSPRAVVFRFDEVVSERPPSATNIADLFLISPRDGAPRVSWDRDAIAVRPRRAWRSNTAYTVTMLGGISDIRGNVRNRGASTFFSTGPTLPRTRISGQLFDWVSGSVAASAMVESFVAPDSSHAWVGVSDSSGRFSLEHVPPGRYLVRGFVDRNRNRGIDPGEAWDSVSVALTDSSAIELFLFAHDSVAPRIRDLTSVDSVTLRAQFDRPVDPAQQLSPANFAVVGPDSVAVPIVSAFAPAVDTSAVAPAAVAPTAGVPARPPARSPVGARRDTAVAQVAMSRPRPITQVVIRLARPLTPGATYRVRALGLRGLTGVTGDSERTHVAPAAAPPPAADTTARPVSPATPP